jgi:hypothetical protein
VISAFEKTCTLASGAKMNALQDQISGGSNLSFTEAPLSMRRVRLALQQLDRC